MTAPPWPPIARKFVLGPESTWFLGELEAESLCVPVRWPACGVLLNPLRFPACLHCRVSPMAMSSAVGGVWLDCPARGMSGRLSGARWTCDTACLLLVPPPPPFLPVQPPPRKHKRRPGQRPFTSSQRLGDHTSGLSVDDANSRGAPAYSAYRRGSDIRVGTARPCCVSVGGGRG